MYFTAEVPPKSCSKCTRVRKPKTAPAQVSNTGETRQSEHLTPTADEMPPTTLDGPTESPPANVHESEQRGMLTEADRMTSEQLLDGIYSRMRRDGLLPQNDVQNNTGKRGMIDHAAFFAHL